jgi:hypothetical protein
VKAPESEPSFLMSTVPVVAGSPGRMLDAVRTARPSLEFRIRSVPAENVFAGLADEAVKLAPEPTTAPTERASVSRAPSAVRGLLARSSSRDMGR